MKLPRREYALRIAAALLLAATALALFLLDHGPGSPDTTSSAYDPATVITRLDGGIDSVLAAFRVDTSRIRKRDVSVNGDRFARTERYIRIPPDFAPAVVNAALNDMARKYGARAVASENLRARTVTIHIEFGEILVHTIIMRYETRRAQPTTALLPSLC